MNPEDESYDYIGKIERIMRIDAEKVICLLQVNWFYRKRDIDFQKYHYLPEIISESEVFSTRLSDIILVDSINGKANILSFKDYDKLDSVDDDTFFTRARLDVFKN